MKKNLEEIEVANAAVFAEGWKGWAEPMSNTAKKGWASSGFIAYTVSTYTVRDTGGLALNSDFFLHNTLREVKSKSLTASRSISKHKEAC